MKVLGFLFWFLFLLSAEAVACSCMGPVAPCEAYWQTPVIFTGTVIDISKVAANEKRPLSGRRVRFNVHEAYRGFNETEAEVLTGSGGGDCGFGFTIGKQYLIYAYRQQDNSLYTGICSRTRPLSDAADDLNYIRSLGSAAPGATVFGEVKARHKTGEDPKAVEGAKIIVEGTAKVTEATTDEKGRFHVSGLPAGTYKVTLAPPERLSVYSSEREAKVFDRGCAQVDFWLEPDNQISGKVLDSQGQPAADVLMELVSTDPNQFGFETLVRTDAQGEYVMKLVRSGSYRLGVRVYGSAGSTYVPYPRTYYPGVSEKAQATIIEVTDGNKINLNDLILPPRLIERTLTGIVVGRDGRPVKGATVWLKENEYPHNDMPYRTESDDQGRFSFRVYQGINYTLDARHRRGNREWISEPFAIRVYENDKPVRLTLNVQ